jgi:hypothetical protein
MSLVALANHLAEKGRGDDKMLVHMTPGEVQGLQALALAHGGSLTVNPETGLVEAGWLKKLLPAIAGFALNFIAPGVGTAIGSALGMSGAVGTGLLVGGVTGLATGSLRQGIMAGLGAYGGASLAGGLTSAGYAGAQEAALSNIPKDAVARAAESGLSEQALRNQIAAQATQDFARKGVFDQFTSGIGALGTEAGRTAAMQGVGGTSGLMRAGTAAMLGADAIPTTTQMPSGVRSQYPMRIRPMDVGYTGRIQQLPMFSAFGNAPAPAPAPAPQEPGGMASGGIVALAAGGPTPEQLKAQQAILNDPQAAALAAARSGIAQGLSDQQIADMVNQQYGKSFTAQNVADFMAANQLSRPTPPPAPAAALAEPAAPIFGPNALDPTQRATPTAEQLAAQQSILPDPQAAALGVVRSGVARGLTNQQIADIANQTYGKSFSAKNVADFMAANDITRPVYVPPPLFPGVSGATPGSAVTGAPAIDYTNAPTMGGVKSTYEQGGGSTKMPVITDIQPTDRTYKQNEAYALLEGYLKANPNALYGDVVSFARSKGIPDMQARAAYNEFRFSGMTGGSKSAYDYLMGRGAYPVNQVLPNNAPLMRPYYEAAGISSAPGFFGRKTVPTTPSQQTAQSAGTTGARATSATGATGSTTTSQTAVERLRSTFDRSIFSQTPEAKAAYYNSLLAAGYDDATIRAAINAPLDENWAALQSIAARLRAGTTGSSSSSTGGSSSSTGGSSSSTGGSSSSTGGSSSSTGATGGAGIKGGTTLLGGSSSRTGGSSSSTINSSGTPITDFLFGTQDASTVPVEDRTITRLPERSVERSEYDPNAYDYDVGSGEMYTDEELALMAGMRKGGLAAIAAGAARGGQFNLGGYSDGGRLLRGPGDGVSDSIPATIGNRQPARLADGEFVIPARIVSEIGNGSTEAGARKLYAMMDRVQRARAKTTGKGKVAKNTRADKYLPA